MPTVAGSVAKTACGITNAMRSLPAATLGGVEAALAAVPLALALAFALGGR
jgi:hypothetical protein